MRINQLFVTLGLAFVSGWGKGYLFFVSQRSIVKRTLDDIYIQYFSSQVMLVLRRRLRGHFVTVIQIVQSLSVVGVLCFCSPLRCICEEGGVNFLILSTGLKQQAAVRIQSGKT